MQNASAPSASRPNASGPLAPLRNPVFRALWIAMVVSNIGTWMQTVGAQWVMVGAPGETTLVALVQTAASLPVLFLAIPSGVVGEFVNRRIILIWVQASMLAVAGLLTVLSFAGAAHPVLVLVLTFLLGAGAAVQLPTYQAIMPDVIEREHLLEAATLTSISINLARAIGPALAGVLIVQLGIPFVFMIDAITYLVFLLVMIFWRGYRPALPPPAPFFEAVTAGFRYVRHDRTARRILVRLFLFVLPANAMWALLPLHAGHSLGLDPAGYGALLGAIGVGALLGAFVQPRLRAAFGVNRATQLSAAAYGLALVALAVVTSVWIALPLLLVIGMSWMGVIAALAGSTQSVLPAWVRARGISLHNFVQAAGLAIGATLAGLAAEVWGVVPVLAGAGIALLVVAASQFVLPLLRIDLPEPATTPLRLAEATFTPDEDRAGSVLVLLRYHLPVERTAEFAELAPELERVRRRTGAARWRIYRPREEPGVLVEAYRVGSWAEHLQQHGARLQAFDREIVDRAQALSTRPVEVEHLIEERGVTRPGRFGVHAPAADLSGR